MRAVCLSIQSADGKVYDETAAELREEYGYDITVRAYNYEVVEDDPIAYHDMVKDSQDADFIFVRCMSDPTRFKRFDQYEKILRNCRGDVFIYSGNLDVRLLYRDMFKGTDEDFFLLILSDPPNPEFHSITSTPRVYSIRFFHVCLYPD